MAETYCGKTCAECKQKEILSCAGCKQGPGRITGGDCRIAKCCREKGHQECSTCGFCETCSKLRGKQYMPEYRLKAMEAEKCLAAQIAQRAPVLGRWIWILFWLIIPDTVAAILTNKPVVGWLPSLLIPGQILGAVSLFAYGIILLRLTPYEERYSTAGICKLVGSLMNALLCIPFFMKDAGWLLVFGLIAVVANPISQCFEFTAHRVVLSTLDNKLADKWTTLTKWYIGMYCVLLGTMVLPGLIPFIGALWVFAAAIGMVAVSVLKLVFLYITAKRFREYSIKM